MSEIYLGYTSDELTSITFKAGLSMVACFDAIIESPLDEDLYYNDIVLSALVAHTRMEYEEVSYAWDGY